MNKVQFLGLFGLQYTIVQSTAREKVVLNIAQSQQRFASLDMWLPVIPFADMAAEFVALVYHDPHHGNEIHPQNSRKITLHSSVIS
jgi:hypothetical protein